MPSYKEKLSFQEPQDIIMSACQVAAAAMKWKIVTQERTRLVIREQKGKDEAIQIPVQIEIKVLPLSAGTGIEITASNVGFGAAQTQRVQADAENFKRSLYFELDRPNMERRQAELELEKEAERERKRQAEERAFRDEEEQRAAARALVMQQLANSSNRSLVARSGGIERTAEHVSDQEHEYEETHHAERPVYTPPPPPPPVERASVFDNIPIPSRQGQPAAAPAAAAEVDLAASLERLANLHHMGALTDDEFRAAKKKLLRI